MKKTLIIIFSFFLFLSAPAAAQYDLSVSQYMYNRYAVNKAFAGSREALSLFGSFRKKWAGVNGSPSGQYFSGHTPLKNSKIALGLDIFNQQYAVSQYTGFSFSYTYRIKTNEKSWLGFALSGGGSFTSADWSDVFVIDEQDPSFSANESTFNPIIGFGASFYNDKFFAGISIPSFFVQNEFDDTDINFDLSEINYIATAGYNFSTGEKVNVQPSFLAQYDGLMSELYVDINTTLIYNNLLWAGVSYRT
ncbi:MAG: type IX secretion system membrane protein PorP/SprF, partial [Chlorobi bacterium]|nr:type IX secretion system membrane protein PorP/SprF [Chlorobiota bacterium]